MGRGFRKGVGGGGAKPKQIFLYKNGADNTELTGGLSSNGYTFASGYTDNGYVNFETDAIRLDIPNGAKASLAFGTTITVDVTKIASVVVRWHPNGGEVASQTLAIDITSISGQYYISVLSHQNVASSGVYIDVAISSAKNYAWDNRSVGDNTISNTAYRMFIDEIELIPKDTTQIDKNIIIDNAGQLNPKYLLQGNASQDTTGVRFTRPQSSTDNVGYIIGVDFTDVNHLVMKYVSTSSVYIRLNGTTITTISSGGPYTIDLDVSQYSGIIPIEVMVNNYASIILNSMTLS